MRATTRAFPLAAAVVITSLVAASCALAPGGSPIGGSTGTAFAAELERFGDCRQLRDYFVDHAVDMVGPFGLEGPHHGPVATDDVAEQEETAGGLDSEAAQRAPAAEPAPAPVEGEDYSTTNVQEAGVDEPDLAKTDGRRLVTVRQGRLHVIDVTGAEPVESGEVRLPEGVGNELLLKGDRALVLGTGHGPVLSEPTIRSSSPQPPPGGGATSTVSLVDLAGDPEVVETLTVDGAYVSARLVDGVARIVLRTKPVGLDFTTPEGTGVRAEREATERNRAVVEQSEIDNWLPAYVRESEGDVTDEGLVLDCADVHRPADFGGLGLAAVFTLDPDAGLDPSGSAAVVGASETVYATPNNLYVATQRWAEMAPERDGARPAEDLTTALHRFAIGDPHEPAYEASGEVPGRLLNQWALSEHDGHLRVATTEGHAWGPEEGPDASESAVRVLDDDLEEVGAVKGLGVGERIYAVRYAGDIGYVVTFREIDPLYTIDLSEPTDPAVLGELKITGYSGYLHPIGEGRLLGVGQEATEDGRTEGAQASLFDVTDLANPRRIDQLTFSGGHTPVEHDHRALLHWAPEDLLVMPLEQHPRPVPEPLEDDRPGSAPPDAEAHRTEPPFSGAVALRIEGDRLVEVGRVSHPGREQSAPHGPRAPIDRALVAGDVLYTVGPEGVLASDLTTLEELNWIEL